MRTRPTDWLLDRATDQEAVITALIQIIFGCEEIYTAQEQIEGCREVLSAYRKD